MFAEQREGVLHEVGLELLSKARELADQVQTSVTAVLLGDGIRPLARSLIEHGADTVMVCDRAELQSYRLIPYTLVMAGLIKEHQPEILLLGATAMGTELAPRLAAKVRTGLSAHCVDLKLDDNGVLRQEVPGWGGGVIATITCPDHRPQMATVMPGAMKKSPTREKDGAIIECRIQLPEGNLGPRVREIQREEPESLPLEKADVVVAGGWGIGSSEDWAKIEELAAVLGGAVGATRPPVDEGWAAESQMIGQSGKTVRPTLYIGVGISGVMHHIVGMDQSKHIISVNSDPNAEIFDVSDIIVVEDFRKIVPRLIEGIKAKRKKI